MDLKFWFYFFRPISIDPLTEKIIYFYEKQVGLELLLGLDQDS